ncbi:MAG: cytochrome C oxidase subunit IV family protein [Proteobacteria bacterium]|nr:cytochrome C oxidase subunit IV family protein [Pseudomonadota bacterium]
MTRPAPLLLVWLALMALTMAAMAIGHVGAATRLAGWEVALLLALALVKARLVLAHYLELPRISVWSSAILWLTGILLVVIFGLVVVR